MENKYSNDEKIRETESYKRYKQQLNKTSYIVSIPIGAVILAAGLILIALLCSSASLLLFGVFFLLFSMFVFFLCSKIRHNKVLPFYESYLKAKRINEKYYSDVMEEECQIYVKKEKIISECEKRFYDVFKKHFGEEFIIQKDVNLASIVNKNKKHWEYQSELFRNIDFGFFDQKFNIILLIEINDSSHRTEERKRRDKKVREICTSAEIPLLTFYTDMPNNEEYIVEKVNERLEEYN